MAKPAWMRDLDQQQVDFYLQLSGPVTVCRGKRRHKFPGIVPGEPVPDTVEISRVSGIYQVTEHCERGCGRFITYDTDHRGVPDYSTARYGGWKAGSQLATGLGLTAADDQLFMAHQQAETVREAYQARKLQAAGRAAAVEAARREHPLPDTPASAEAKFQAAGRVLQAAREGALYKT